MSKKPTHGKSKSLSKKQWLAIAGVALVVIVIAAIAIYVDRVAPFRTTVLSVDDSDIDMRTLVKRTYLSGLDPLSTLQTLAEEEIIKQVAPYPPYNIVISDEHVELYLRNTAGGDTLSEDEYKEWLRQQVNNTTLSKKEFLEVAWASLLLQGLELYLQERVPRVAEQAHIQMVTLENYEQALNITDRVLSGESFVDVARDILAGIDETDLDLGWIPRSLLKPHIARAAFDELEIGEISAPLYLDESIFAVMVVLERANRRELDDSMRLALQDQVLDDWLLAEQEFHDVTFYGFSGPYDSETDVWVRGQVERLRQRDGAG